MKDIVLSFLGGFFPAVFFNIDRKNLLWAGISGTIGWEVYKISSNALSSAVFGALLGAFCVGLYGETMARIRKSPALVFTIPGIFPLVPGINAYNTVLAIVEKRISDAYNMGIETIGIAGAIAFGIMLATAFFKFGKKPKSIG